MIDQRACVLQSSVMAGTPRLLGPGDQKNLLCVGSNPAGCVASVRCSYALRPARAERRVAAAAPEVQRVLLLRARRNFGSCARVVEQQTKRCVKWMLRMLTIWSWRIGAIGGGAPWLRPQQPCLVQATETRRRLEREGAPVRPARPMLCSDTH